jgi:hypothetical protein
MKNGTVSKLMRQLRLAGQTLLVAQVSMTAEFMVGQETRKANKTTHL